MAYSLRAPILGDPLYATAKVTKAISDVTTIPAQRTFLHASLIEMDRYLKTGPKKRIRLGLRAPLPADFLKICSDASLPINPAFIKGGVTVDGTPIDENTFPPLEGKWQP
ncbi:hypothetical protein ONZ45_g4028 [Pleurotus djamor]|nr:hypothetical protein ONZ45_g4028 [Pleurotus djamor]